MKKVFFISTTLLLIILMSSKPALCQKNVTLTKSIYLSKEFAKTNSYGKSIINSLHFDPFNKANNYLNSAISVNKYERNFNVIANYSSEIYYYNSFDIFFTSGFAPFKFGINFGYLFKDNLDVYIGYNILYLPMIVNYRVFLIGTKLFFIKKQTFFISLESGIIKSKQSNIDPGVYSGFLLGTAVGWMFYKNNNFYIQSKLKLDTIINKTDRPEYYPGFDFSIGWYINKSK